jgi:hypothetical protein
MKSKFLYLPILLVLTLSAWGTAATPKKNAARPHQLSPEIGPNRLSQRISALQTLYQLQITREQLEALKKIATETAAPASEQKPVQIKQDLKRVMQEFHTALVAANNSDKIETLEEKYDGLLESETVEFDDSYDITEAASEKAEQFCRSFTITQVVSLVSANQDDIRDPRAVLVETLTEGRNKTGNDWNELRDSAAEDAATLMAGDKVTDALTDKYKHWLDEAHELDDTACKQRFPDPLQAAEKITGPVVWPEVLRNWVQSSIADLLSNPELSAALNERLK